jgi:hypothetical protein
LEVRCRFLPRPAWATILLFYASCCHRDIRHAPLCPTISWEGVLKTLPGLGSSWSQLLK